MSRQYSTARPPSGKPAKPYPSFPLFAHMNGQWTAKIRGKHHHFGVWADPNGALKRYLEARDAIKAGLPTTPDDTREGLTVLVLCGKYLTSKKRLLATGELSPRSYADYSVTCRLLIKSFHKATLVANLRPEDFEKLRAKLAKKWGPVRLGNEVNRVRGVFRYAVNQGLIDKPVVYGDGFKRPSRKTLRKHRADQGPRMFSAHEVRAMLNKAGQPLRSMLLLAINCGYGNNDVATLPLDALDLEGGWVNYARPKTGIMRRCPLWLETVDALREWLTRRPTPRQEKHAGLVFVTRFGDSWASDPAAVTKEANKLRDRLGIDGHRSFYGIRHTLQTIGDEAKDFLAVRHIMGHVGADIADEYREKVSDDRLRAVAEHVRGWLFGSATKAKRSKAAKRKPALRILAGPFFQND